MTRALSPALRVLASAHPAFDSSSLWKSAIEYAYAMPRHRSAGDDSPGRLLETLKARLEGEVVAFHKSLVVTAQASDASNRARWQIGLPLTLFPKRDEGFTRVECAMELSANRGAFFRVVDALPIDRAETMAEVGMGAELQVEASGKAGAPILLGPGTQTVATASAKVYGHAKSDLRYSLRRATVTSEVTRGTGAAWRLESAGDCERMTAEGHQLTLIVETEGTPVLNAAAYVKAYSEVQWLTSAAGNLIKNLGQVFRKFVAAGAPAEAYGEWEDILPGRADGS